jgi:hypothetical protein
MSACTRGTCPHNRGVFVWLGDGAEPDGTFPWVHDTTNIPGHLIVCDLMPPATAEEAGEVCACGHSSGDHNASGPVCGSPPSRRRPCSCGCPDFEHRPEDLARWREAGLLTGSRFGPGETTPRPADEDEQGVRLSAGEAVPGHHGACKREGCAHLTLWHGENGRFKGKPCRRCPCQGFTREAGQVMPLVQGSLFDGVFA